MSGPSHSELVKQVMDFLRVLGYRPFKNMGVLGMERGRPDIDVCARGRWVSIEVKTGKGRMSTAQGIIQGDIVRAGGTYIVARCLEDVLQGLRQVEPGIDKRVTV